MNIFVDYVVFVLGLYCFGSQSCYFIVDLDVVVVDVVSVCLWVVVDIYVNVVFVVVVLLLVDVQLKKCVMQMVFFFIGCFFGQLVVNWVLLTLVWLIVFLLQILIVVGEVLGSWQIVLILGIVYLSVMVILLYDGLIFIFDQDVLFYLQGDIIFGVDDVIVVMLW